MAPSVEKPRADAGAGQGETGTGDHRRVDNKLARQLLRPRRRAQIEVWLDETVSLWETQSCTAGQLFGHRSDLSTLQPTDPPSEGPHAKPLHDHSCPVCGRPSESGLTSIQPTGKDTMSQVESSEPGRRRHILRGIRAAMGQLGFRDGDKGGSEDDDKGPGRAVLSTAMFLAEASGDGDSSVATAFSSSGLLGGGHGNAPPDQRKALDERMKRLMRAHKLLERSQAGR
jgi:hypothetical protein